MTGYNFLLEGSSGDVEYPGAANYLVRHLTGPFRRVWLTSHLRRH